VVRSDGLALPFADDEFDRVCTGHFYGDPPVQVGSAGKPSMHRPFEPRADERVEAERPRAPDTGVLQSAQQAGGLLARSPGSPSELRASLLTADPQTRASLVLRLQRTAGNAAVGRVIARQPAPAPVEEPKASELATQPHAGGDEGGLLSLLDGARSAGAEAAETVGDVLGSLGEFFGFGEAKQPAAAPSAQPAPAPAPAPAADPLKDWKDKTPTTNAKYAAWIVEGETHGFVEWKVAKSKSQMQDLADGKKVKQADPSKKTTLGALFTLHALVGAKAKKWSADTTQAKETVAIGSFLRDDGHGSGGLIDINKLDWTGPDGPKQVSEALQALPKGKYGIGLPFQGEFFPIDEWFDVRAKKAVDDAKGGDPAPITSPSLRKFVTARYTATWNKDKKDKKDDPAPGWDFAASGSAVTRLKSADLKKAIKDLNSNGYSIYVFPDNDNHIHIQH